MVLKSKWEKTSSYYSLDSSFTKNFINWVIRKHSLNQFVSYEMLAGGCANLNIKLVFNNPQPPLLLRIYIRDQNAVVREQKLANLLKDSVPMPAFIDSGRFENYNYALFEFIDGITLRDLILEYPHENIEAPMRSAGQFLATLQKFSFPQAGFFDKDLNIAFPTNREGYVDFALNCLENPVVIGQLEEQLIEKIKHRVTQNERLFPDESEKMLVHGDYDPSNILVDKLNGEWKIVAILDWEFAFSGSWLCDVATMLRYAHQLPTSYKKAFLEGVTSAGLLLPEQWQQTIHILSLLSLLDCLARSAPLERPGQCADIKELICYILQEL